jgi:hypothetical protein
MVSILHISDLHRNKDWKVSNEALICSLIRDRESYTKSETPLIQVPDIIIVSGDLIHGSRSKNIDDAAKEINAQYDEALNFLCQLTNEFLAGNKERIILVPGNHDISFAHSRKSMNEIDLSKKSVEEGDEIIKKLFANNSKIRWSWRERKFYEISDLHSYEKRLEAFANFYQKFYDGKKSFSLQPEEQYEFFDLEDFNVTIVGFSSCHYNDHLNFSGSICPDAIAKAFPLIKKYKDKGRILIAVWHHNTKGAPIEFNYMDSRVLKNLIDYGFVLGFHGHQHQSEIIEEILKFESRDKLHVISSGTLCGGPPELPTGINRQYNILELDNENLNATLHSRQMMQNVDFQLPIWQRGRIQNSINSFVQFQLSKSVLVSQDSLNNEILELIATKNYDGALKKLEKMDFKNPFVRKAILECYSNMDGKEDEIIDRFSKPIADDEALHLLDSYKKKKMKEPVKKILELEKGKLSPQKIIIETAEKILKILMHV